MATQLPNSSGIMRIRTGLSIAAWVCSCTLAATPPAAPPQSTPRSAVTSFLEASSSGDYGKAADYLDLRRVPPRSRARQGPELARKLEAVLNSDAAFSVVKLSDKPEGNPADDPDPNREHAAQITQNGRMVNLDLERVTLKPGSPPVWLFSADTVAALPGLQLSSLSSVVESYLPRFMVSVRLLETPLWKWAALILLTLLLLLFSRLIDYILRFILKFPEQRYRHLFGLPWLEAVVQPLRVIFCLAVFGIGVGFIDPSAIARLYIGRAMNLVLVWSIAWCLIRLVGLFMSHLESNLHTPHQLAERSMLRLGRRTASLTIVIFAILLVLENWGYNTATLIAGLGVGGIAVALAAQQSIANIFGGVSLIGDQPVRIGEFGKFGDMVGVVEDIGMRSTRVRTLNRTLVSVPNANFAGLNLENYSVRDKILFNPVFQVKRSTADEQLRSLMDALGKMLSQRKDVELALTPARLTGLSAAAYSLELFCYVRTADVDEFYKIQSELLVAINRVFTEAQVEIV